MRKRGAIYKDGEWFCGLHVTTRGNRIISTEYDKRLEPEKALDIEFALQDGEEHGVTTDGYVWVIFR